LSEFYSLLDSLNSEYEGNAISLLKQLNSNRNDLQELSLTKLLNKLSQNQKQNANNGVVALNDFVKKHPDNDIGIHLMDVLHYGTDPLNFYAVFKLLKPALKNSERGKYIGNELSHLVKLVPGVKAPYIYGNTMDGTPFELAMIDKKLILVEFWRSGSDMSRTNHEKMIAVLSHLKNNKKIGLLSVSFDSNPNVWLRAVKDDQMNWLQISDLKGVHSPNIDNWMITQFPTYYLVDNHWNIIKGDLYAGNIDAQLSYYMENYP
jgi:hypothetical protein